MPSSGGGKSTDLSEGPLVLRMEISKGAWGLQYGKENFLEKD